MIPSIGSTIFKRIHNSSILIKIIYYLPLTKIYVYKSHSHYNTKGHRKEIQGESVKTVNKKSLKNEIHILVLPQFISLMDIPSSQSCGRSTARLLHIFILWKKLVS